MQEVGASGSLSASCIGGRSTLKFPVAYPISTCNTYWTQFSKPQSLVCAAVFVEAVVPEARVLAL